MKTRTIKELLTLVRDFLPTNINNEDAGSICWSIVDMRYAHLISEKEEDIIWDYIQENKPSDCGDGMFFWPYRELAPRMEFLNKLISEL